MVSGQTISIHVRSPRDVVTGRGITAREQKGFSSGAGKLSASTVLVLSHFGQCLSDSTALGRSESHLMKEAERSSRALSQLSGKL